MVACSCKPGFSSKANSRIAIEQQLCTADEYGGRVEAWSVLATVWAIIEPMTGREVFTSLQVQSRVDARITIRYRADMSSTAEAAKNRDRLGSRIYNIQAVRNLADDLKTEGRDFQQLLCSEGEAS